MSFPLTLSSLMTLFPYILLFTFFFPFCYNMNLPNLASSTTTTTLKKSTTFPTPSTIPAFPDQSNVEGCPITLSDELLNGIKSACSVVDGAVANTELHRSRCCPVLAAWLYYAYSSTSLGKLNHSHSHDHGHATSSSSSSSLYEDMPLMPDDSETCVNGLGKALEVRGVELRKPNETCDVVYCYCGIRLHPFSCTDAFSVTQSGELVGDKSVRRLEKDCLSSSGRSRSTSGVNGFPGLGGCSKCLNSLYLLNKKTSNSSKAEDRTTKIHNKDCELMGLTWLLSKNRTAYMHTVSAVLRALLLNTDHGSNPQSCTLNSDGMPLAVDSSEISGHSSSTNLQLQPPISLCLLLFLCLLLCMHFTVLSS